MDTIIDATVTSLRAKPNQTIDYKKVFDHIYYVEMQLEDVIGRDDVGKVYTAINELKPNEYDNAAHTIRSAMRRAISDALLDSV